MEQTINIQEAIWNHFDDFEILTQYPKKMGITSGSKNTKKNIWNWGAKKLSKNI